MGNGHNPLFIRRTRFSGGTAVAKAMLPSDMRASVSLPSFATHRSQIRLNSHFFQLSLSLANR
jgi:hypothetical protein